MAIIILILIIIIVSSNTNHYYTNNNSNSNHNRVHQAFPAFSVSDGRSLGRHSAARTLSALAWKPELKNGILMCYSLGAATCEYPGVSNIGALISRIGFWGPLYYDYNKEPPK